MSKSLYEKFANIKQPKVLEITRTFGDAVSVIKDMKLTLSAEYVDWAEEIISRVYNRTYEEVRDAVDGKEAWINIGEMYK
jgi:hypothetical protein